MGCWQAVGCWQGTAYLFWLEATFLLRRFWGSTANAAKKDMPSPASLFLFGLFFFLDGWWVGWSRGFGTMLFWELVGAYIAWERLPAFCFQGKAGWFQGEAGEGGVRLVPRFHTVRLPAC